MKMFSSPSTRLSYQLFLSSDLRYFALPSIIDPSNMLAVIDQFGLCIQQLRTAPADRRPPQFQHYQFMADIHAVADGLADKPAIYNYMNSGCDSSVPVVVGSIDFANQSVVGKFIENMSMDSIWSLFVELFANGKDHRVLFSMLTGQHGFEEFIAERYDDRVKFDRMYRLILNRTYVLYTTEQAILSQDRNFIKILLGASLCSLRDDQAMDIGKRVVHPGTTKTTSYAALCFTICADFTEYLTNIIIIVLIVSVYFLFPSDAGYRAFTGRQLHDRIIESAIHTNGSKCRTACIRPTATEGGAMIHCSFHRCEVMIHKECSLRTCPVDYHQMNEKDSFSTSQHYYCDQHLPVNCMMVMNFEASPYNGCVCNVQSMVPGVGVACCSFARCPSHFHIACMTDSAATDHDDPDRAINSANGELFCRRHLPRSSLLVSTALYPSISDYNDVDHQRLALFAAPASHGRADESISNRDVNDWIARPDPSIQYVAGALDPLLGRYCDPQYAQLCPSWYRDMVANYPRQQSSPSRRVTVSKDDVEVFVHQSSRIGHPLEFGLKCKRLIKASEVITNYGGVPRDATEMRNNANSVKTHAIEMMNGDGLVLDGFPLRRAMLSAVPKDQTELDQLKNLPSYSWGYDTSILSTNIFVRQAAGWGIGFMINRPHGVDSNGAAIVPNAKFENVTIKSCGSLSYQVRIVRAIKDIPIGAEILCEYNTITTIVTG